MTGDLARDREHILEHTRDLWEELRGERVFVTGGTGFVGTWLVEAFCAANAAHRLGARMVLLTRDPARFARRAPHLARDSAVEFVTGEASTFAAPPGRFPFVVHAATERAFPATPAKPVSVLEGDVNATRRVLDFASAAGARRFLFTSSGAAYGRQPPEISHLPESYAGAPDPADTATAYGHGKRISEFFCHSYARVNAFDAVVARLFAFVGPHLPLDEGYAVGNFLRDVIEQRAIAIAGDGTPLRSYLYAADLAIWLWTMLFRGSPGCAYNVGSEAAVSIRELAETIALTLAPGANITVARTAEPGVPPPAYVPSTAKAREELRLHALIPLKEALRRTFAFHARPRSSEAL